MRSNAELDINAFRSAHSRSEHAQFQDFENRYFPHKHCLGTLMVEVRSHFNQEHMLCICI